MNHDTDLLLGQHPISCRCAECQCIRREDRRAERAECDLAIEWARRSWERGKRAAA